MQKSIIFATIFAFFSVSLFAQGLNLENIKPKATILVEQKKIKTLAPLLYLPKVKNHLVCIEQNVFYSQHRYPQAYLHQNHNNYFLFMDKQLFSTQNQKELFIERLVDVALIKLFGLD